MANNFSPFWSWSKDLYLHFWHDTDNQRNKLCSRQSAFSTLLKWTENGIFSPYFKRFFTWFKFKWRCDETTIRCVCVSIFSDLNERSHLSSHSVVMNISILIIMNLFEWIFVDRQDSRHARNKPAELVGSIWYSHETSNASANQFNPIHPHTHHDSIIPNERTVGTPCTKNKN